MWLLITLVLWVGISVPLALLAGRALRPKRRTVADEAEAYLRSRSPRRARLALSGAVALSACTVAGLAVLGQAAVEQLPAARLAATRGIERFIGSTSTTAAPRAAPPTTAAERPAKARAKAKADADRTPEGQRPTEQASPARVEVGGHAMAAQAAPDHAGPRAGTPGDDHDVGHDDEGDRNRNRDDDRDERRRRDRNRDEERPRSTTTTTSTTTPPPTTSTTAPPPTTTTTEPGPEPGTTTSTTVPDEPEDDD